MGGTAEGLDGAGRVEVSADGRRVTVDGNADNAIAAFIFDTDVDADGVLDDSDNCATNANANQANNDGDAQGDACDPDDDNDGAADGSDNCALVANANQANADGDSQGDACDADDDNDGVPDTSDTCPLVAAATATGCAATGGGGGGGAVAGHDRTERDPLRRQGGRLRLLAHRLLPDRSLRRDPYRQDHDELQPGRGGPSRRASSSNPRRRRSPRAERRPSG